MKQVNLCALSLFDFFQKTSKDTDQSTLPEFKGQEHFVIYFQLIKITTCNFSYSLNIPFVNITIFSGFYIKSKLFNVNVHPHLINASTVGDKCDCI